MTRLKDSSVKQPPTTSSTTNIPPTIDSRRPSNSNSLLHLHSAAATGNIGLVKFALDHGAGIDSVVNGYMPLQMACISDSNIAVVQYLIDRGADVNLQRWSKKHSTDKSLAVAGATGSTALHVAAANGCTKVVELLLRNGALVDVKDKYGSTPLSVATAKHHTEIVNILETFRVFQVSTELQNLNLDSPQHHHHHPHKIVQSKSKLNRLRRPSLPTELDGKASDSSVRTSLDHTPVRHSVHLSRMDDDYFDSSAETRAPNMGSGHLSPAKSGEESSGSADSSQFDTPPSSWEDNPDDQTMCEKDSFVSYSFEPETYVESLERRAYGSVSDDHFARHIRPQVDANGDSIFEQRASLDHFRPPISRPSLSRSNSDISKLRNAALMNSMAANSANSSGIEDDIVPRPSLVLDDGPEAEALRRIQEREVKKAWWGGFGGRKSVDVVGRRSTDHAMLSGRKSVDFRPSLDGISSLAKKSMESLSRRSNDYAAFEGSEWEIDVTQTTTRKQRSNSFLSRFWS